MKQKPKYSILDKKQIMKKVEKLSSKALENIVAIVYENE